MLRKYGRHIPEALLPSMMLSRVSSQMPVTADLRKWDGPIKDQQQMGSCTGHEKASTGEWIYRKYYGKQPVFSPLFIYSLELEDNGTFPNDEGSDGTTGCEVVIANGLCEDSLYPDASQVIQKPTDAMLANALTWRLKGKGGFGAYHGLTSVQVAMSVMSDPVPWPVGMGFTVYPNFESDEVAETGIYVPDTSSTPIGGHQVKLSGYDVALNPIIRPKNCPPAALVQNSWGTGWGLNGYVWVALSVLSDPQTDLKVLHAAGPWE
jgi:hypothetical protein